MFVLVIRYAMNTECHTDVDDIEEILSKVREAMKKEDYVSSEITALYEDGVPREQSDHAT